MSESARARRRARVERGRWAETLAVARLWLTGHRILARNLRTPFGEIDIVGRRGQTLIAIEVKARADESLLSVALSARQQARIGRALVYFQAGRPALRGLKLRFDLILVGGLAWPRHYPDAFRPGPTSHDR